jgi:hypothetical protein
MNEFIIEETKQEEKPMPVIEYVEQTALGISTHYKIKRYFFEDEQLILVGDLIIKENEESEVLITNDAYHNASKFNLTIEDFNDNY